MSWWYAFRQIDPNPPGGWVIDDYRGPHASHHDALMGVPSMFDSFEVQVLYPAR